MSDHSPATGALGVSREVFMSRVRQALERDRTGPLTEPTPVVDDAIARLASADANTVALFEAKAIEVGMKVHRVNQARLPQVVVELLQAAACRTVAVGIARLDIADPIAAAIDATTIERKPWRDLPQNEQFGWDAGITDVHAALAETGTLVCASGAQHSRGLSLIPPLHFAVVRVSDVLPDMLDYWSRFVGLPNTELPSSISFITGPSKTADIEGELIVGVHGPGAVHILLVEDA